jgi:hypothetical protein
MLAHSTSLRLRQNIFNAARFLGTGTRNLVPPALARQEKEPSSILFLYGLPTSSVRTASGTRRIVWDALSKNVKDIYSAASAHAPVVQVRYGETNAHYTVLDS